ncbi:N-acetyl sugar amidotransferase [Fusobacterium mortiferum]|uniref:N-acetyl sugar amidotransferase n=1 Tax=Fusobacterium mortiferum TaxID=850 RepID=A0ABS2FYJ0_FUSMR|nr:N-acetyl sugar amidotransferase [Fusobacterium mortiferum]MBM6874211.1 N-acetyl sugar amidotransferase [Fusobacterium mortiferum]
MSKDVKVCNSCVMDTSDKMLILDENGICSRCNDYNNRILKWWNYGIGHEEELNKILNEIKKSGKGKKYDCILGLSGGLDSSYLLHLAVAKWGLRPFVFHVDAGWNLPVAEKNIRKICEKLNVDLHIEKMDFEEMRQMQIAFFKTGHAGLDAPQDHAFVAQIDKFSEELEVKYILNGYNICTEIIANPASWNEGAGPTGDKTYIKDVLKKHGGFKTKKYVYTTGFKHKFWLPYVKGVKTLQLLNYVPFTKKEMIDTLVREYDYEPYKQKHFEDLLTKFLEGWWLPTRFGYDIRRAQLSSLVITGQMTREEALEILKTPPLSEEESKELFSQVAQKLNITEEELMSYYNLPKKYIKYKNNEWAFKLGIKLYTILGLDKRIRQ